ncbi:hypothetical protein TeGR_g4911 [Tetraparma gracilis]|uniref:Molybdopterin synthase sulfur carrier subunit n=1 Tax=Tetraparma gracilis TaxID=2962635 RepID=A0ABQ6MGW2_9STRA|nr:hypothetical protein TeGR_g4911 [Tetraparma gracilis]
MSAPPITVTVLFFASSRSLALPSTLLSLPAPSSTASLLPVLLARFPKLRELVDAGGMVLSVDGEYATGDTPLRDGAEVAVIPPISGG